MSKRKETTTMSKDWCEKIEQEIEKLKQANTNACMVRYEDKIELKSLITDAVKEATNPILVKLEEHEKRIRELEDQDGKKAILILKTIGGTTLSWFVLGVLSHVITLFD